MASAQSILYMCGLLESILGFVALYFIVRSQAIRDYWAFGALLAVRSTSTLVLIVWITYAGHMIGARAAYTIYFYAYWITFGVEAILSILTIYSIYKLAMAPLQGLQSLGILVFKWAAAISTAIALGITLGPTAKGSMNMVIVCVSNMQRCSAILTLSLLLFVCFAIRPMGLSFRSRIFGVNLGLGLMSTINMLDVSWLRQYASLYTTVSVFNAFAAVATVGVWIYYFAVPEPKRRFILLPTTSPFLRWNQISELLGHNPGYVAVGGFSPESFSPAELEIMRRASRKMSELPSTSVNATHAA